MSDKRSSTTTDKKRRERLSRPIEQLLDRVLQSINRLVDAYQEGLITKEEFETRLKKARIREASLKQQHAEAKEHEQRQQHYQEVLGEFRDFAKLVLKNLSHADMATKIHIVRLLIRQIEVDLDEVRIIYKVGQRPFDMGPFGGILQHYPQRRGGRCIRNSMAATWGGTDNSSRGQYSSAPLGARQRSCDSTARERIMRQVRYAVAMISMDICRAERRGRLWSWIRTRLARTEVGQ